MTNNNAVNNAGEILRLTGRYMNLIDQLNSYATPEDAKDCLAEIEEITTKLKNIRENLQET